MPDPRVRVVAAKCENCGPECDLMITPSGQPQKLPQVVPAAWLMAQDRSHLDCGGQVRVQTEPVEEEAK